MTLAATTEAPKNKVRIYDDARWTYKTNSQIKLRTAMLKTMLMWFQWCIHILKFTISSEKISSNWNPF